mgnify:CR=1 FL=1
MTSMPMISKKVFVDTNVFIALRDTKDSTHRQAIKLADELSRRRVKLFTSSDVLGETLTVLSRKLGKAVCNDWYQDFQGSGLTEIFIDKYLHQETREFFRRVKSKNISFIDCSSVVAMKRHKIKTIFSFDQDFKSLGVKLA